MYLFIQQSKCFEYFLFHYRTQLSLVMRDLILRFPHLAEQIFKQLDNEDLAKSREVEWLWKKFIDERNYPWLRIVNIPTILQDGSTYMHIAAECGQTDMFEKLLDEEENKNPKTHRGVTPFLVACKKGHLNIALILLKISDEFKIDLNSNDKYGQTAFHLACWKGHSEVAEMLMKNSKETKIDPNIKDSYGRTAFYLACWMGHSEIAEMIIKNSSELKIDLNSKDNCYSWTAFHLASRRGHIKIVDMMIEQSESLELDLQAEDSDGKTGYQMAKDYDSFDVVNLIQTKMPCLAV